MASDGSMRQPGGSAGAARLAAVKTGCEAAGHDVPLYVDGELAAPDRAHMEQHLDECSPCREAVAFEQAFRSCLRRKLVGDESPVGEATAPAALRGRLQLALEEETPPQKSRLPGLRRFFSPVPLAAAGATALGVTAWLSFHTANDDIVRELVARHARRLPLEIQSSDPQSLERWLQDKVDFRVKVPRLAGGPFTLLGARLSHVRDHAAVYLLLGTPQSPPRHVSMVVYDDPSTQPPVAGHLQKVEDRDVYTANAAGYNVAVWKQNEVVYSLVSDGDDNVLDLVRAANR